MSQKQPGRPQKYGEPTDTAGLRLPVSDLYLFRAMAAKRQLTLSEWLYRAALQQAQAQMNGNNA